MLSGRIPRTDRSELVGVVAIVASVSFVAIGAYFAKRLLADLPANQVLWLRFVGYVVCLAPWTLMVSRHELVRPFRPDHQIYRGVLAVGIALFFLLGLRTVTVSQAVSIFYVYPILMCLGGIVFLGEDGSRRLWLSLGAALVGVLLIVRPHEPGFDPGLGFILLAALLVGARMVLHRHYAGRASPMVAAFWERGVGSVALTLTLPFAWAPISGASLGAVAGLTLASVAAQLTLVYAISRAPLVRLAPFTYWEVLFALLLDVALIGTVPDPLAMIGMAVLVVSGFVATITRGGKTSFIWRRGFRQTGLPTPAGKVESKRTDSRT